MLNTHRDHHLDRSKQPRPSKKEKTLPASSLVDPGSLALQDAKYAIAQDSLLKPSEINDLLVDDFDSPLYFHREAWDEFEWRELYN